MKAGVLRFYSPACSAIAPTGACGLNLASTRCVLHVCLFIHALDAAPFISPSTLHAICVHRSRRSSVGGNSTNGFAQAFLSLGASVYSGYSTYISPIDAYNAGITMFSHLAKDGTVGTISTTVKKETNITSFATNYKQDRVNDQWSRVPPPQWPLAPPGSSCAPLQGTPAGKCG